ncbi:MAG TPA: sulfatase-like hydrolase/transferase [Candidatus Dormibacteraeota bacterium]|nr:sulfatase-like hydrolase/transferase [Candidatus Dormibacteraeota bacterium]
MRRSTFLVCCFLAVLAASAREPEARKNPRRDVFLITIDTLRADHVRCYGYDRIQTPALDQLAKDGIRFIQAFTPTPLTNTSHTTILTGLLPSSHGVTDFGRPLGVTHSTLAELLKNQGYQTAAFIGSVVLDSKTLAPGLGRGFDFYDDFPAHPPNSSRWGRVERRAVDVVRHAKTWLDAHQTGPHLVWLHLYDPHDPYEPPAPYSEIYKDRPYDGEIAYADAALGNFISYLKKHGWYDQALVIVVGDHGEGLGEHNEDTHGIFLYDSTTRVPLILKLPGHQTSNRQVDAQVRTTDILPTILDLLSVPPLARRDGDSLKPYFVGTAAPGRTLFGETDYPQSFGWAPLRSVREEGFKFIEAPRPELYDLHSDPGEIHSLYQPWNPVVQKLRGQLAALREKSPTQDKASPGAVGVGTTDELRALGYLGPADALSSSNVPEPSLLPDPKDKIAQQNLLHAAMLAQDDARTTEARALFLKVLEQDSKSPAALTQLGQLELTARNYAQAADYFARARQVRLDDANIAFKHGEALNLAEDLHGALEALQASLKMNPSQYPARLLLAQVYFQLHDVAAAQDQLEAALLLQPTFEAEVRLAEVLLAEEKYADAVHHLDVLAKLRRDSPEVYDLLARAYKGLHKDPQARQAENRAKLLRNHTSKP